MELGTTEGKQYSYLVFEDSYIEFSYKQDYSKSLYIFHSNLTPFGNSITDILTKTEASSTYQPKGDYLTSIPSEYITEEELNAKNYASVSQLSSKLDTDTYNSDKITFATKDELTKATPTIGENGNWFIGGIDSGKTSKGDSGVSLGEIALSQELSTAEGSENQVISQKVISENFNKFNDIIEALGVQEPQQITITPTIIGKYRNYLTKGLSDNSAYTISQPIDVLKGDIIKVKAYGGNSVSVVSLLNASNEYVDVIQKTGDGVSYNYYVIAESCKIDISYREGYLAELYIYHSNLAVYSHKAGGPNRDLYEAAGAVYNEETGFYELNGLTDITESEMALIYNYTHDFFTRAYSKAALSKIAIRTNLPNSNVYNFISVEHNMDSMFRESKKIGGDTF